MCCGGAASSACASRPRSTSSWRNSWPMRSAAAPLVKPISGQALHNHLRSVLLKTGTRPRRKPYLQDPEEIWSATIATARTALAKADAGAADVAGIGITNQRETSILWDRVSGKPIHNAVVWQDRRTSNICATLRQAGYEPMVAARTG